MPTLRDSTRSILRTVFRSCSRLLSNVDRSDKPLLYLSERAKPTDWGGHRSVLEHERAARLVSALAELRKGQRVLPLAEEDGPKGKFGNVDKPVTRTVPVFPSFLNEVSGMVREPGSGVPAAVALRALGQGFREGWDGSIGVVGSSTASATPVPPLDDAHAVQMAFGALRVVGRLVGAHGVSSEAKTEGILVLVSPEELMRRTFAYKVRIVNTTKETVQLVSRHWIIEDGNKSIEVPRGSPGVVGAMPKLEPGAEFEYTSGTQIESSRARMGGSFIFVRGEDSQEEFEVLVAPFDLVADEKAFEEQ